MAPLPAAGLRWKPRTRRGGPGSPACLPPASPPPRCPWKNAGVLLGRSVGVATLSPAPWLPQPEFHSVSSPGKEGMAKALGFLGRPGGRLASRGACGQQLPSSGSVQDTRTGCQSVSGLAAHGGGAGPDLRRAWAGASCLRPDLARVAPDAALTADGGGNRHPQRSLSRDAAFTRAGAGCDRSGRSCPSPRQAGLQAEPEGGFVLPSARGCSAEPHVRWSSESRSPGLGLRGRGISTRRQMQMLHSCRGPNGRGGAPRGAVGGSGAGERAAGLRLLSVTCFDVRPRAPGAGGEPGGCRGVQPTAPHCSLDFKG